MAGVGKSLQINRSVVWTSSHHHEGCSSTALQCSASSGQKPQGAQERMSDGTYMDAAFNNVEYAVRRFPSQLSHVHLQESGRAARPEPLAGKRIQLELHGIALVFIVFIFKASFRYGRWYSFSTYGRDTSLVYKINLFR